MPVDLRAVARKHQKYRDATRQTSEQLYDHGRLVERLAHCEVFQGAYQARYQTAAEIYDLAARLSRCASNQRIRLYHDEYGIERLATSNDAQCRKVFCIACCARLNDRRSGLVFHAIEHIWKIHPGAEVIAITLTVKNYPFFDGGLERMLDDVKNADANFRRRKAIKEHTLGIYSSYEIALRGEPDDLQAGVHIHALVIRGKDQPYLTHAKWQDEWRKSLGVDYTPQVRLKRLVVHDDEQLAFAIQREVRHAVKYTAKTQSFIQFEKDGSIEVDPSVILTLARASFKRRFFKYDRIFTIALKRARAEIQHRKQQRNFGS